MYLLNFRLWPCLKRLLHSQQKVTPAVVRLSAHPIKVDDVSVHAIKVIRHLQANGYEAYLVGGAVRDLFLQKKPKDFDVVTNAVPEQIRKTFRNSRIIGRRFRLVHIYFPREIIEVSTFRAGLDQEQEQERTQHGMILADNTYGSLEEDAWRRDLTVNAMYYAVNDDSIIDFTGGVKDMQQHLIRVIGDPAKRFHEDPMRMLRAIRFAAKLDFKIHADTDKAVRKLKHLLKQVSVSRVYDEFVKLFQKGHAQQTYQCLQDYSYLETLFPLLANALKQAKPAEKALLNCALQVTDERFNEGQSLNPGFLVSIFLWLPLQQLLTKKMAAGEKFFQALHTSASTIIREQAQTMAVPRRAAVMMRDIWLLQYHMQKRRKKRVYRCLYHRYFRAAVDFLQLRAAGGEDVQELAQWWFDLRFADKAKREQMLEELKR